MQWNDVKWTLLLVCRYIKWLKNTRTLKYQSLTWFDHENGWLENHDNTKNILKIVCKIWSLTTDEIYDNSRMLLINFEDWRGDL